MPPPELLTAAQVADRHQVNRRTVNRWAALGLLQPAVRLPGDTGALLFDAETVEAFEPPRRKTEPAT